MTKYTDRTFYEELLAEPSIQSNEEYVTKLNSLIERLDRKNANRANSPTKNQVANVERKERIISVLQLAGKGMTAAEIANTLTTDDEVIQNQRVTALLTQLRKEGRVTREEVKRVAYYSIVEEE